VEHESKHYSKTSADVTALLKHTDQNNARKIKRTKRKSLAKSRKRQK